MSHEFAPFASLILESCLPAGGIRTSHVPFCLDSLSRALLSSLLPLHVPHSSAHEQDASPCVCESRLCGCEQELWRETHIARSQLCLLLCASAGKREK